MGFKLDRDVYSHKLSIVVGDLIGHVLTTAGAKVATKYLAADLTVKATYQGKPGKVAAAHTVLVTIGSPNYAERQFIKVCKKAGESFPIKKVQLKFAPKTKHKKK